MTKVLMDDSSLNAIANSIRRKNGLVRTYKPREMAPAIRAFAYNIPSAHDYTITINQSEHQRIIVRKYLDPNLKEYTQSFTVAEPNYKLDISIEADAGWLPGTLNYQSPVTVDRDMIISATPATKDNDDNITDVYINGNISWLVGNQNQKDTWFLVQYSDEECTKSLHGINVKGKVRFHCLYSKMVYGMAAFGNSEHGSTDSFVRNTYITEMSQDLKTQDMVTLAAAFKKMSLLKSVDISNFQTGNCESFSQMFQQCSRLRNITGITNLDTSELLYANSMFQDCSQLVSLDLSSWKTPKLRNANGMFSGCTFLEVLDISGWDTSKIISTFSLPSNIRYVIMDDETKVKFSGSSQEDGGVIFSNPNTFVKYLVPANMVNLYKEHPNWQSRASQIENIDKYTITRSGGEVWVSPNPY